MITKIFVYILIEVILALIMKMQGEKIGLIMFILIFFTGVITFLLAQEITEGTSKEALRK